MATRTIAQLFDLSGKGAIVTGSGRGIGRATAFRLAEAGASVMIVDVDLEAASQTTEQIRAGGGKAQATKADASSAADAKRVARSTVEAFGHLDILINNAGIYPSSPDLEISEEIEETWDKVLNINLKGIHLYSLAAAQEMIEAGQGGKVINIASLAALRPPQQLAHYAASKGGVVSLTNVLALALAPHNILVNAIAPGTIMTSGLQEYLNALIPAGGTLEDIMGAWMPRVPLGRIAEPDEIAKVVLFLASAAADYMTGSLIVVDGGYLLS